MSLLIRLFLTGKSGDDIRSVGYKHGNIQKSIIAHLEIHIVSALMIYAIRFSM